jgi:hypothetical protein
MCRGALMAMRNGGLIALPDWLGRQDSNLGMAGSKSKWFALFINAHSEKSRTFDLRRIKRIAGISECRRACRALPQ